MRTSPITKIERLQWQATSTDLPGTQEVAASILVSASADLPRGLARHLDAAEQRERDARRYPRVAVAQRVLTEHLDAEDIGGPDDIAQMTCEGGGAGVADAVTAADWPAVRATSNNSA